MSEKTHYKKLFPKNFLGAHDLPPKGATVTIESVRRDEVFVPQANRNEERTIIKFAKAKKEFVCNVTNADAIAKVAGSPFIEDWKGVQVQVFPTKTKLGRDTVDCVRIKAPGGASGNKGGTDAAFSQQSSRQEAKADEPVNQPATEAQINELTNRILDAGLTAERVIDIAGGKGGNLAALTEGQARWLLDNWQAVENDDGED